MKEKIFGKSRIEHSLDNQLIISHRQHNDLVKKNRAVLKKLIDVVSFLGTHELSFRGHDESSTSTNRGNYVDLISLISRHDSLLMSHLEQSTVFRGTSNHIQYNLISAIGTVVLEKIKLEIKQARFVSIVLDETTDITNVSQLSAVLRYLTADGIKERFLGFIEVTGARTADSLYKIVCEIIKHYECTDKLVVQSYDGAAVMAGHLGGLQAKWITISAQISSRFGNFDNLKFIELCNFRDFQHKAISEDGLQSLMLHYGNYFEIVALRSQLSVVSVTEDTNTKTSASELLNFLNEMDLNKAYSEVVKLCELIVTIPATSASVERSFSVLKRIKNFVRNSSKEDRLSNLAVLSIGKDLLKEISEYPRFYDDVIAEFSKNIYAIYANR
ncbi:hypothetical protein TcasGA2_TC001842 [Tribolium castaneum]|uniref:Uncharacterized protein n=1 Tax=Tribolium castaneum TaxID=7070 RepID=D7EJ75_TRICA|nr:hypothetical protein TcasGA2_TC001842 [Tribolium castaneum]